MLCAPSRSAGSAAAELAPDSNWGTMGSLRHCVGEIMESHCQAAGTCAFRYGKGHGALSDQALMSGSEAGSAVSWEMMEAMPSASAL